MQRGPNAKILDDYSGDRYNRMVNYGDDVNNCRLSLVVTLFNGCAPPLGERYGLEFHQTLGGAFHQRAGLFENGFA